MLLGGSPEAVDEALSTCDTAAREHGMVVARAQGSSVDRWVPFGALQPWFARAAAKRGPHLPREQDATWLPAIALAGLLGSEDDESDVGADRPPRGPEGDRSPVTSASEDAEETLLTDPGEVRSAMAELVLTSPTLVSVARADLLDPESRAWLATVRQSPRGRLLTLVLSLPEEGPPVAEWQHALAPPLPLQITLPRPPPTDERGGPGVGQLAGLTLAARRALLAVSLAAPDASEGLLEEVLGVPRSTLEGPLQELLATGWVGRQGRKIVPSPRSPGSDGEPTPELWGVPSTVIEEFHRRIARGLERRAGVPRGRLLFRVADHEARGHLLEPGVGRLLSATSECERWGSLPLAEVWAERALRLSQREATSVARSLEERVQATLAGLADVRPDPVAAAEAYRRALELAARNGAPASRWARYAAARSNAMLRSGQDPESELRTALERSRGGSPVAEAILRRSLARLLASRGRHAEGMEAAETACELASATEDRSLQVQCLVTLSAAVIWSGTELPRARQLLRKALTLEGPGLDRLGVSGILASHSDLAYVESVLGDPEEACRQGELALTLAQRAGTPSSVIYHLGNLAELEADARRWERARALVEELERLQERRHVREEDPAFLQKLLVQAKIAHGQGHGAAAQATLEEFTRIAERHGVRFMLWQALLLELFLADERGDDAAARRLLHRLSKEGFRRHLPPANRERVDRLEQRLRSPPEGPPPGPA